MLLKPSLPNPIPQFDPHSLARRLAPIVSEPFLRKLALRVEPLLETGYGRQFLTERYYVELFLYMLLVSRKAFDVLSIDEIAQPSIDFVEFIEVFLSLLGQVEGKTREDMEARFRGQMNAEEGFTPLVHECHVAHMLHSCGFEILIRLDEAGSDFYVRHLGRDVLIEAKAIDGDVGRPLSERQANMVMERVFRRHFQEFSILQIDGRPEINAEFLERLDRIGIDESEWPDLRLERVGEARLSEWRAVAASLGCSLIEAATRCLYKDERRFLAKMYYTGEGMSPGAGLVISTERYPNYVEPITKRLKERAGRQLTGQGEKVFVIRMNELVDGEIRKMFTTSDQRSPLRRIANKLFASQRGASLTGIAFIAKPRYRETGFLSRSGEGFTVNYYQIRWFSNPTQTGSDVLMGQLFGSRS